MESIPEPLKVTFFPPLHHQRRIWILDILRRERFTEVLDLGCGEGALLETLCQPAPWLRPSQFEDKDQELSALFRNVGLHDNDTPDLHVTRVAGLDISAAQLNIATQCTSPAAINPLYTRWEHLDIELWQGSVDVINPVFVNMQCIVATELIEHLTDDVLTQVAPVVLGVYRPRMFLITTPSYTFNKRWSAPGTTDPQGYPDPTGRTDRVFRNSDHRFEWTVDEFVHWCEGIARQWGYVAETAAIGVAREQDPWGRDGDLGGATQVASFRRLDDRFSLAVREHGMQALRHVIKEPHMLVARHCHKAHPRSGRPSDAREVEEAMVLKFHQWGETTLGVHELWSADNLPVLCGGSIEVMLDAAEQSAVLGLQRVAGQRQESWKIQLVKGLTGRLPEQSTQMESGNVMCEDEDLDCDVGDSSFDSGVHMGISYDGAPPGTEWPQLDGGSWGNQSWEDTSCSEWGANADLTECWNSRK